MRVCAIQLNLKHCADFESFKNYLQREVFDNLLVVPDLLVFPENINFCLCGHVLESQHTAQCGHFGQINCGTGHKVQGRSLQSVGIALIENPPQGRRVV